MRAMQSAMEQAETDKVTKEVAEIRSKGLSETDAFNSFKEQAQQRHAKERTDLESQQMVKNATEIAKATAAGKDVAAKEKELDAMNTEELNTLEVAQYRGISLGQKELAPTQHEVMQQQSAAQNAQQELAGAKQAMSGMA